MFANVLKIVGAVSLVFVLAFTVTFGLGYSRTVHRSSSSKFFWYIVPALIWGFWLCFLPSLVHGNSEGYGRLIFNDFSEFLARTGFYTLPITAGVVVYWIYWSKEEARAKKDAQNKDDAKVHCTLAMHFLSKGDIDLALKEYQIVKERDEVLATELYDQIFS